MEKLNFKKLVSIALCIAMVIVACPFSAMFTASATEPANPNDIASRVDVGENLYSYDGETQQKDATIPTGWTQLDSSNCNWLYNTGGTLTGTNATTNGGPGVNLKNDSGSGGVVFPSVNTADYVLTVRFRIASDKGQYGLMTNITDPLSEATGATLSYITLTTANSVTTGTVKQYNRVGSGQYDIQEYNYSKIGNSGAAPIYPGAIVTMKVYSLNGCTYYYINDEFVASGMQKNPETKKSLCGVYCYGTTLRITDVSIDALTNNDIRTKVMAGKSLYSYDGETQQKDATIPTGWTQLDSSNCNWLYNTGGTLTGTTATNNGGPGVNLKNDSGSGGVVFPSVNTADYVLTVRFRIASDKGQYGLMTNITDPLSEATGATLSYITLTTANSATTGTVKQYNRVGSGQYDIQEYNYSKIGNSGATPIYPGAIVTMQAYSYNGYTYYYINDEFVASGAQKNSEIAKSLCGVYCYGTTLRITDVSINEVVGRNILERVNVGENLYSYDGETQQKDATIPTGWTQLESSNCNWLYNTGGTLTGTNATTNGGPGVNLKNDSGSGGVVFPSVNTADYVLTVRFRIASDKGQYGLMTNITDPLSEATGATLSHITLTTANSATTGTVKQYNRVGSGQYDIQEYNYSKIGNSGAAPIYPGAIVTMKVYSLNGCTYYYINDEFVASGMQKNPETEKSLCGVYCYGTTLRITDVSIDALNEVIPVQTVVDCDFEDSKNMPNYNTDQWSVVYDEATQNNYLQRAAGNSEFNSWGFVFPNTRIIPGRTYKISFKVKANRSSILEYAVSTAKKYNSSIGELYSSDHNEVKLNAEEWKNVECYFTGKYYSDGTNAAFRITTPLWNGTVLSFDDIVIKEVSGMSFCEYDNKYSTPYIVEADGETLVVPYAPERENYIFEGWYVDGEALSEGYKVVGYKTAIAKWSEAVISKDDIADITKAGNHNLGIKVTNANNYPVKFSLETTGKVTVSIYTDTDKSSFFFNAKSVVWTRTFESSGEIGALITPATIKNYFGNAGDTLYISLECANGVTASITDFVIGGEGVPTSRKVEGDVNGDEKFDAIDIVRLKKMSAGVATNSWIGDIDDDGFIASASDIALSRKGLLGDSTVVTEIGDRTLVWNDEFDGNALNGDNFAFPYDKNFEYSTFPENVNVSDGKLNLNITKSNGRDFAKPSSVVTENKMSYKYGYLEMRAKMACSPDQWFGLWLYSGSTGDHEGYYGEIDIVETNQEGNGYRPNVHVWDWEDGRLAQYAENIPLYSYSNKNFNKTEYHTFGFEWDETSFKFYVDGNMYQEIKFTDLAKSNSNYADIVDDFYSIIISNGYYDTLAYDDIMPKSSIDYIRLYQKAGEQIKINGVLQ